MHDLFFRLPIRISAFLRKEIFELLRQPRLILTLVLGPFLILLLFGIGYRAEGQPLRASFVMAPDSPFRSYLEEYATEINPLLIFSGVTDSLPEAEQELLNGDVDVVIALPEKPYETVRQSEQATFMLYHNEIDPIQGDYVRVFGRVYVDEVNRRVLRVITEQGQQSSASLRDVVTATRGGASAMREALEQGDAVAANRLQPVLGQNVGLLALGLASNAGFLEAIGQTFGGEDEATAALLESLRRLQTESDALADIESGQGSYDDEIARLDRVEEDLGRIEEALTEFRHIVPQVIVSPFRSETRNVSDITLRLSDFYAPAVIALLIQHIAITFAALSIVSERLEGSLELFRVSPLSSMETLLGKYGSYVLFEIVLGVVLTALLIYILRVPMLGEWWQYALILLTLVFTSLGVGFTLSLVAETTTQAVQFSMIVLLASIFFSGFFLSLELLWQPVRIASWMLPATYAIQLLQDVMLRGRFDRVDLLLNLAAIGLALFLLAWLLMRRQMAQE